MAGKVSVEAEVAQARGALREADGHQNREMTAVFDGMMAVMLGIHAELHGIRAALEKRDNA